MLNEKKNAGGKGKKKKKEKENKNNEGKQEVFLSGEAGRRDLHKDNLANTSHSVKH